MYIYFTFKLVCDAKLANEIYRVLYLINEVYHRAQIDHHLQENYIDSLFHTCLFGWFIN